MSKRHHDGNGQGCMIEQPRVLAYRLYRPSLVAAAAGVLLSLLGAYAVAEWEERITKVEFDGVAETQAIIMQNGMNEYVSRLEALRTLFESTNEEITRSEYETFSRHLFAQHPGILRVAWAPKINRKERAEYEAAAIDDGVSDYHIKSIASEGNVVTAPESDQYFPIFFSTEAKTSMVYGLDYWSEPARRATLERARDEDHVTVLRTRLVTRNEGIRPLGVLICVPVFVKGTSHDTFSDRRRNLTGFIVGIFNFPQLLQSIRTETAVTSAVSINVYPSPDAQHRLEDPSVPDFSSEKRPLKSNLLLSTGPQWRGSLKIGDATWLVRATPTTDGPLIARHDRAVTVLSAGIIITAFLAIYLGLSSRNARQLAMANRRILQLAQTDILTRLPNRAFFLEQLKDAGARRNTSFSILLLDLDRFKNVNDSFGHAAGDALLRQVAHRLRSEIRSTDVLARLGGDEFAIIQRGGRNEDEAAIALAIRIINSITQPFDLDGHQASVGISIGIALAPEHGVESEELLKSADLALYTVKVEGRNDFRVFQPEMLEIALAQQSAESELREAIEREEFELHYQPVANAKTRQLCGVEALVRWRHPTKGLVGPDQFIPLAESTGLIVPLGDWVLQRACSDAASWPACIKVAVNISAVQFKTGNLFDVILCTLVETGLAPDRLELEITETALLENQDAHLATIRQLKNLGISIALDDFGTGYSSMNYLTVFPFDKIKIDKSFTQGALNRHDCKAIIASTLALAQGLGTITTAEGVETEEQLAYMREAGVDLVQGYLLGRPVPVSKLDLNSAGSPKEMVA